MSRQREGSTECEEEAAFVQCVYTCVCVCVGVLGVMTWGIGGTAVYSSCSGSFEEEAQMGRALGLAKCTAKTRNKCHYFVWGVHAATR